MNLIMFGVWGFLIPIAACAFILLFSAMTQAYILATVIIIAYYDVSVIKVNTIVTIVINTIAMIIFPGAYLKVHNLIVWIFILVVYLLCAITALLISSSTYRLFLNVKEITTQIEVNFSKLDTQNEYFANVFRSMQNMTELLNVSAKTIDTMGQAHHKQAEVIKKTVSINQDIGEGIKEFTERFDSINAMAESNANNTNEVTAQANAINDMVDEMTGLFEQDVEG